MRPAHADRMLIRLTIALLALLWTIPAQSGDELVYSHQFGADATYCPGDPQYDDWLTYRASLPSEGVLSITVSGSQDQVGRTCADPALAQQIADAMRDQAVLTSMCGGINWAVGNNCHVAGGCGNPDNDLVLSAGGSICSCSTFYVLRPGIANQNWGGIQSRSCDSSTQTMTVTVVLEETNEPPDCSLAYADPEEIWPPNGKLIDVSILGVTDPEGDPVTLSIVSISQDEPPVQNQGHDQCPDASGVGTSVATLRAKSHGKLLNDGRVYHVNFVADDGQGGQCSATLPVCVPHDQRGGGGCVDQGALYDSTTCGGSSSTADGS